MIISPDDFLYQKDPVTGQQTYVWSPTRVKAAWQETFRLLERAIRDPKFTKLVLLVGIPAAGKSTWLKSHHEPDSIYIDATFTQKWSRKKPIELAKQYGKRVEAVYLDVPLPVSLERNSQRSPDRRVPDDTIINMAVNLSQEPPSMSEGFDKIIKVQTKQASSSGPAELHVYDFDATLFRSPDMSARWKNWWMEERSLTLPCVPDKPGPEWWNGAVVAEAKKSISNPNVYAVLITGRSDRVFRWRIPEMLRDAGLKFDAVFLNQGGNVPAFKTDVVKRLLGRYRFIDQVKVWDDSADNHVALKREVEGQGLSYEGIKPKIKPMPVDCDEEAEANPKIKPVYTAVFLDSTSRKSLEDWWETNVGPLVGEAIVDHVTLVKKPTPESLARLPFGTKFKFRVTGWADNGAVQAVSVEPPPELLVESGVPHVTVSTDGTPPSASIDLIKSGVNRVNGPILTGTLGWSDGNRPHYKTASRIAGENEPTDPKLWSKAVAEAKKRFKVYPSAYANGWASKWYKERGGGWRKKAAVPSALKPAPKDHPDPRELAMGIKVELEHTKNKAIAERIALHHLAEDPKYYTHLLAMEARYVKAAAQAPGTHTLPPLPYAYDALEPYISEETLRNHHGKHHKAYVEGLNKAEKKLAEAQEDNDFDGVFGLQSMQAFHWSGHFLHSLYWKCLTPPDKHREPSEAFVKAIEADFTSWDTFKEQFKASVKTVQGSGWAVLVHGPTGFKIASVRNHEDKVLWGETALLPMDAWEHAYYLDYESDREAYFDAVFDHLINWEYVESRFAQARNIRIARSKVGKIDPDWVKGVRAWIKKTFVPKAKYASLDDLIAHLKTLRDKDLNRFWEYLFYTKGFLPPSGEGFDSVITKIKLKVREELKAAKVILDDELSRIENTRDAMTPGTHAYRMDQMKGPDWSILGFYESIDPNDPFGAALRGYEDGIKETLGKVEDVLSGKLLRAITAFITKNVTDPSVPWELDEILLEYNIGNVKLVYDGEPSRSLINRPDPADPRGLKEYIPYFKTAKALLDRKGFGNLWYGPIFVGCPKCGGENPHGKHLGVGAHYLIRSDYVVVFSQPSSFIVELLIHELGHRYYYKFMDSGDRARFDSYFKEVAAVSEYGSEATEEDFAEVFTHFVLGLDMTRDQIERFKAFLAKKDRGRFASSSRVAARYLSERKYKMPRKFDRNHCESKTCDEMGFTEKASCRPYKDCYRGVTANRFASITTKIPASVLYPSGWEWDMGGFANWPQFLKKPKAEQIEWAKEFVKDGIREPVTVTVSSDGEAKFEDGHHRVMAGTLLGIEIPVRIGFINFDSKRWPELLKLLKAGYTIRQYNPQRWSLKRSGIPPLEVVRQGPQAADEWIVSADEAFYSNRLASRYPTASEYPMNDAGTFVSDFFRRYPKLSKYQRHLRFRDRSEGGSSGHGEARQHGNEIWLFPKFWKHPREIQDFVLAHEIGHWVFSEFGGQRFIALANEIGIDPWDTSALPFGQFNMNEAFADSFASYHTDGDVRKRYPAWTQLTEAVLSGARVARGKAKKDVGHGGLDEWFSGHGGAKGKGEEARWGDWVAISPVKKTLDSGKKVEPGDIVGPCGISDDPDWKEITKGGKDPLKCMPRQKAHDMPKKERAEKAKGKLRAERKDSDRKKKPTMTPTFEDK